MGKYRGSNYELEYELDSAQAILNDVEYDLDDEAFFEQFEPKVTRKRSKLGRNVRRRIEEYPENQQIDDWLAEYYGSDD